MAFTLNGRTQTALADINITPLVDVVLVLLVIFMLTAPVLQSGIEVAVPKTKTVKEITEQRQVLTIDRDQQRLPRRPANQRERHSQRSSHTDPNAGSREAHRVCPRR